MQKKYAYKNYLKKWKSVTFSSICVQQSDLYCEISVGEPLNSKYILKHVKESSKNELFKTSNRCSNCENERQVEQQSSKQFRTEKISPIPKPRRHRAHISGTNNYSDKKLIYLTPILNDHLAFLSSRIIMLSNDVEQNPGPIDAISCYDKQNLTICSYNVNGIKNFSKLKRVTTFLNKLPFKNNCIINLQETHLNENEVSRLTHQWRGGIVTSNSRGSTAGVAILYNPSYFDSILNTFNDDHGRICSLTANKEGDIICFINIYAPNDHIEMLEFLNTLETHILNISLNEPNTKFIIAGDFNVIMDPGLDSVGRRQTRQEANAVGFLKEIMIRHNLIDSYRALNNWGGFTWGRDNPAYVRSRLDMILISKYFETNLQESTCTKYPNESDHYFLYSALNLVKINYGPGIIRCNSALLDNPECKDTVNEKLQSVLSELPEDWTPHLRLDFVKTKLRQFMLEEGRKKAKIDKSSLLHTNKEISRLEKIRDSLLMQLSRTSNANNIVKLMQEIDKLSISIEIAKEPLDKLKNEESDRLIFRSKAKWSEEGEKSTKYFYNLLKQRQNKMIIRKLISNGITSYKQNEITKAIENFYKKLYDKQPNLKPPNETDFLTNLPQLEEAQKNKLNQPITLEELENALKTCKESAPGYDGITYNTYKHLWHIFGPLILNAWTFSMVCGETSQSQRHAVITLLEKNGKDRTKIENLRPISLSNCDIKICTKAIAIRTNEILEHIISTTQTGYVPGRQVNDNNRLIDEVINHYENIKSKAYLITLDAQKAFDSVDHSYLEACLKAFNFPDNYLTQIKTIYTKLTATVMVNGFFSQKFDIKQSVKQGDALSCSLFIIAMEPLLRQFNSAEGIHPIIINPGNDQEIVLTNISYADDITILCVNEEGIQTAISLYERFSKISGVKLNVPKTEILIIGDELKESKLFRIVHNGQSVNIKNQDTVKICGITYSLDKDEAYKQNVTNKITKMERQLNIWRQRNLTLEGKILIVKTFGLSQLIYSMQAIYFKQEDIKKIENIIYKFIWNIKPASNSNSGRIKRSTLECAKGEGGLNSPNVMILNEAIKYKTCIRHLIVNHPMRQFMNHLLLLKNKSFDNNYNDIKQHRDFIDTALVVHNRLSECITNDIEQLNQSDQQPHKEYFQYLANYKLINMKQINRNQRYLINNLRVINVRTIGQLKRHRDNSVRLYLEASQLWNTIPIRWRAIINKSRRWEHYVKDDSKLEYICINYNKWLPIDKISCKDIKTRLQSATNKPKTVTMLNEKFNTNLNVNINPFIINNAATKNVKIRNVQYKILHNAYPTMSHLYNWRIKNTPNCATCNVVENIEHAIWTCPIAQQATFSLSEIVNEITGKFETITKEDFLFGRPKMNAMNVIFTILKRTLILQRENKRYLTNDEIKNLIKNEMQIEKYISKKNGKENEFIKRWDFWITLL
jgi:exonuclease III/flavodoxin